MCCVCYVDMFDGMVVWYGLTDDRGMSCMMSFFMGNKEGGGGGGRGGWGGWGGEVVVVEEEEEVVVVEEEEEEEISIPDEWTAIMKIVK